MDKEESHQILMESVRQLRATSYHDLLGLIDNGPSAEVEGPSGRRYSIQTSVFWDDKKGGDLRVLVAIDDGGWSAYAPLTEDFIMAPHGTFVGE
jgi:hypothetical protein